MKTEIIAVGTELLLGQTINTNATFISEKLASIGYEVYYQSVVGDNKSRLTEQLEIASKRSELVILCGGLGPTEDDLTKETVAEFIGVNLLTDQGALEKLENRIRVTNRKITANNLKQAQYLATGEVIKNDRGLAIGTFISYQNVRYVLLPGPPTELHRMVDQYVIPKLIEISPEKEVLTSKVMRFYGIGESALATMLADIIDGQSNPTLALYAQENEVTLRITAKGQEEASNLDLIEKIEKIETDIMTICGEFFYGYDDSNSLFKEFFKTLPNEMESIQLFDFFSEGRLSKNWLSEGSMILLETYDSNKGKELSKLDRSEIIKYHDSLLRENKESKDISVLLIGSINKNKVYEYYEGVTCLSVRINQQFFYKKSQYAGNYDTIKERSTLETTSFVKRLLRKEQKANKHSQKA